MSRYERILQTALGSLLHGNGDLVNVMGWRWPGSVNTEAGGNHPGYHHTHNLDYSCSTDGKCYIL